MAEGKYLSDLNDQQRLYAQIHPQLQEGGEIPSLEEFIKSKIGDLIQEYARMYKRGGEND